MEGRKLETGRGMMMRCRYGSRTGFLGVLAPSVSIEDCTIVGPADYILIVLTACRE